MKSCWSVLFYHQGSNPDFETLKKVRQAVAEATNINETDIELSMGMSKDFEEAIKIGSTNVRVGSSIFGARNYPNKDSSDKSKETNVENVTEKLANIST